MYTPALSITVRLSILLQSLDVDDADTMLLSNLYWTQTAAVRCDKDLSEWTSIKQGVRQGCVASPHLFALYTKMIMRHGRIPNWWQSCQ